MLKFLPKSIAGRVNAFCGFAILMAAICGVSTYYLQSSVGGDVRRIESLANVSRNHSLAEIGHEGLRSVVYAALSSERAQIAHEEILRGLNEYSELLRGKLEANLTEGSTPEVTAQTKAVLGDAMVYISLAEQIEKGLQDGAEAGLALFPQFDKLFKKVDEELRALGDTIEAEAHHASASANDFSNQALRITTALAMLGISGVIALTVFMLLNVLGPFQTLVDNVRRLRDGETKLDPSGLDRSDEIGDMSRALAAFREALIAKDRHEQEAINARLATEQERHKKEEQDKYYIDAHNVFMASFSGALDRLSAGQLGYRINETYISEYENIRHAFNRTADKLEAAMTAVAVNSTQINAETTRISAAAQHLSKHTEEQASALEETSASMEEMAATVRQNATNALEASKSASSTRDLASEGSKLAADAISAMDKIEQSSQRITEIVGLIEEIAFQTNILALNAAVEAARAGEAGKGFAVVANEVRALSQRSASALKDVKGLIAESNSSVQIGSELVKHAAGSLNDIAGSVNRVASLISEIASASQEQAAGIEQVGRAISNMDGMTQQNATLVEDTNVALQSTRKQVEALRDALSMFKLSVTFSDDAPASVSFSEHPSKPNQVHRQQQLVAARMGSQKSKTMLKSPTVGALARAPEEDWQEF
jgi:methyl-accepting chemotaxis protein